MYANRKYRVDIIFTNYYTSDLPYIYPTRWGFAITWWLWAIYTKIFNILESFLVDGCQCKGWTSPLEIEKCFEKKIKINAHSLIYLVYTPALKSKQRLLHVFFISGSYILPLALKLDAIFTYWTWCWLLFNMQILPQFPLPTHNVVIQYGFPSEFEVLNTWHHLNDIYVVVSNRLNF